MNKSPRLKMMSPQQVSANIPPLIGSVFMGGWDNGSMRALNLGTLSQLWRLSEREAGYMVGKLDSRQAATATIAAAAAVGTVGTATIVVPAGELWFVQEIDILCPYDATGVVSVNFCFSCWESSDPCCEAWYWAADKELEDGEAIHFFASFYTGAPLNDKEFMNVPQRLVAGDVITLQATVKTAVPTAAMSAVITPYGYRAKIEG